MYIIFSVPQLIDQLVFTIHETPSKGNSDICIKELFPGDFLEY